MSYGGDFVVGDSSISSLLDKVFSILAGAIEFVLEKVIKIFFSNSLISLLIFFALINVIAILLMKKDKEFAKSGEKRVRESTLLIVALVGGGIGEYYAMYKYKHKTLHRKFLIGVPVAIMLNTMVITYSLIITLA